MSNVKFDYRKADLYGGALYHYDGRVVYNDIVASLEMNTGYRLNSRVVHPSTNRTVYLAEIIEDAMVAIEVFGYTRVNLVVGYGHGRGTVGKVVKEIV